MPPTASLAHTLACAFIFISYITLTLAPFAVRLTIRSREPCSLAGDYGFDPLKLSEDPLTRRWCVSWV
jgi:hypothetical protein